MQGIPYIIPVLLAPAMVAAQSSADRVPAGYGDIAVVQRGFSGGQFLIAIAAGVVLAFCFQWLLTNLAAALGISALQGRNDQGRRSRRRVNAIAVNVSANASANANAPNARAGIRFEAKAGADKRDDDADPVGTGRAYAERISGLEGIGEAEGREDTALKAEAGLGLWALITSCLALFFACWLAVELIRMQSNLQGAILGLVIWGVFMGTMMRLEGAMASSLLGFAAAKAREGVDALLAPARAAAGAGAESHLRAARGEEAIQTYAEIAAEVRRELFPEKEAAPEVPALGARIRDFVRANVKPKAMDAARMGQEVKALLSDPEMIGMAKRGELKDIDRGRFAEIAAGRTDLDKRQVERMVDSLHGAWSRFLGEHAQGRPGERPAAEPAGPAAAARASAGVAAKYRQFKEFLRSTGREELRPERLEQEVKTLVLDPHAGITQLKEHFKELDRESLVQALGARKDMTPEEANRIAEQIDLARSKVLSAREQAEHRAGELRDRVLGTVRDHVYAARKPEPDYEGLAADSRIDFRILFEDPAAGYAALEERLRGIDRESVIALLNAQDGLSRDEAEKAGIGKAADKIVAAKEAVLERARMIEAETGRRLEDAKLAARVRADAARQAAASAAWWMVAIGCASAVASVLGGLAAAGT